MRDEQDAYDAGPSAERPRTVRELLREAGKLIDRLDAEVLLAHFMGVERWEMLRDQDRLVERTPRYALLVARRMRHEPVAYIIGEREFWSLPLLVRPATLIPRPDSETLIEAAIAAFPYSAPERILDLGTGSGALLLAALSHWPQAQGMALDNSFDALAVAMANAIRLEMDHRIAFHVSDWGEKATGVFDLILCNPPYIPEGMALMPDVAKFEPHNALFAGTDGLDAYRRIVPDLSRLLAPAGLAIFEIGEGQGPAISDLGEAHGFSVRFAQDLSGRDRAAIFTRKALGKGDGNR